MRTRKYVSERISKRKLPFQNERIRIELYVYVFLFRTCNETSLLWEVIVLWYRPALLPAWNENNLLGLDRTLTQVINLQSQPKNFMKMGFPGSSYAFSSLYLHPNPVPHSTYKELRSECTRVRATFMQRDLSLVIVSLFTMLFFTETVGVPYGIRIISSVRDLLLVRLEKSLRSVIDFIWFIC